MQQFLHLCVLWLFTILNHHVTLNQHIKDLSVHPNASASPVALIAKYLSLNSYPSQPEHLENRYSVEKYQAPDLYSNKSNLLKGIVNIFAGTIHLCSGAYIKPLWIISPHQCISLQHKSLYSFSLGADTKNKTDFQTHLRYAQEIILYENDAKLEDVVDIGLVKLDRPFGEGGPHQIITLAQTIPGELTKCNAIGWDTTYDWTLMFENVWTPTISPIIILNNTICSDYFSAFFKPVNTVCANSQVDMCQADAGTLLIYNSELIGLLTTADECTTALTPMLFTGIPYYRTWIEKVLKNHGN